MVVKLGRNVGVKVWQNGLKRCAGKRMDSQANIIFTAVATAASNTCCSMLTLTIRTTSSSDGYVCGFAERGGVCSVACCRYAGGNHIGCAALSD